MSDDSYLNKFASKQQYFCCIKPIQHAVLHQVIAKKRSLRALSNTRIDSSSFDLLSSEIDLLFDLIAHPELKQPLKHELELSLETVIFSVHDYWEPSTTLLLSVLLEPFLNYVHIELAIQNIQHIADKYLYTTVIKNLNKDLSEQISKHILWHQSQRKGNHVIDTVAFS